jgi:hypothetical protein
MPAEIAPGQIDLFSGTPTEAAATPTPATVRSGFGGKAGVVAEVLVEIRDQRYGRMDCNDRIVCIEHGERCRYAPGAEAEVVESLVAQQYARPTSHVQLRHGVINRDVYPITLTPTGRKLVERWSALRIRRI